MKRVLGLVLLLLVTAPVQASDMDSVAISFVETLDLGRSLTPISSRITRNTETYRLLSSAIGEDKASMELQVEVTKVVMKYQREWNKNLAAAYLEHFTPEQLLSILNEGGASPYIDFIGSKQTAIAASMQDKSRDLLIKIVAETLEGLFKKQVGP